MSADQRKKKPRTLASRGHIFQILIIIFLFSSFRIPGRYGVIRIAHSATHIHEAAAATVIERTSASCMIREARARRNKPTDDNVLLETA